MERYVKVPVMYQVMPADIWPKSVRICASLKCEGVGGVEGYGPTEEAAFADLLKKLGCEEVQTRG